MSESLPVPHCHRGLSSDLGGLSGGDQGVSAWRAQLRNDLQKRREATRRQARVRVKISKNVAEENKMSTMIPLFQVVQFSLS